MFNQIQIEYIYLNKRLREQKRIRELERALEEQQLKQTTNLSQTKIEDKFDHLQFAEQLIKAQSQPLLQSQSQQQQSQQKFKEQRQAQQKKSNLVFESAIGEVNVKSKEQIETYDQEIQVNIKGEHSNMKYNIDSVVEDHPRRTNKSFSLISPAGKGNTEYLQNQSTLFHSPPPLKNFELQSILESRNFNQFFAVKSKLMEKILTNEESEEQVCALEEIMQQQSITEEQLNNQAKSQKTRLKHQFTYSDARFTSHRTVVSLDMSPIMDNLVLVGFSAPDGQQKKGNDQPGIVQVYSLELHSRPEYTCHCNNHAVTQAIFHPFAHNLIVGGLHNGQIVMWDLRAQSTPSQRSKMSQEAHVLPIYGLQIIGTQHSHTMLSLSNDGKLCLWDAKMLVKPIKTTDLVLTLQQDQIQMQTQLTKQIDAAAIVSNQQAGYKKIQQTIDTTCLAYASNDPDDLYFGAEDGQFYQTKMHSLKQGQQLANVTFKNSHSAFVSSVACQPLYLPHFQNSLNVEQGFILTSSLDWSVKLWHPAISDKCLWDFESMSDYVFDVKWNNKNPFLFSTVEGEGFIGLWNLNDLDAPLMHHKFDNCAINKSVWNSNGNLLLTGNTEGEIKVYSLDKNLLESTNNQFSQLKQIINQNKTQQKTAVKIK